MADVRALLKAKRQEARITHPLASYTSSGQLRCSACGTTVKHASAWEGHLGSKIHRTTVARLKEEERIREEQRLKEEQEQEEQERLATGKRKAEEEEEEMDVVEEAATKRQRVTGPSRDFPADFFSDPSRALPVYEPDSDDEENATDTTVSQSQQLATPSAVDLEWERFQKEVVNAPDARETYESATIIAEPVLASEVPEGFPAPEAEPERGQPENLDEEELRRRKEQEE